MQLENRDLQTTDIEETRPPASIEEPSAAQDGWRATLAPWWQATRATLPTFLITRFIFVMLTYFGYVLFTVPNYSYIAVPLKAMIESWNRWDVLQYATVATQGGYTQLENAAFFPLFPWMERIGSSILHQNVLITGMLISNVAFLGTMIVFYRLAETEFDKETAQRSTLYLAIFPSALFFFAAYNESLFLFFTLLCFYALRRGSWWFAGLFGALATLTRSQGVFLGVIFLYEFIRQTWPLLRLAWQQKNRWHVLRLLSGLPAILLIPQGLLVFAYYLSQRLHDPLAFAHAQVFWRFSITEPFYAPFVALKSMLTFSPFTFSTTHNVIDLTALLFSITLLLLCFVGPERFARNQWSLPLFGLFVLINPLLFPGGAYNPLPSMERFVLEIFAVFLVLARFGRRPWFHQAYLLLSLPMLAFLTLQFITGHWTV